jgi:hypothetical protein
MENVAAVELLEKAGIETNKRAENLTMEQWRNLYVLYLESKLSEKK